MTKVEVGLVFGEQSVLGMVAKGLRVYGGEKDQAAWEP